jgi:hypothetical protein
MTTVNPMPIPTVPSRGLVQRTFVPVRVLAGFTDPGHFQILAGEFLQELGSGEQAQLLAAAEKAREAVKGFSTVPLGDAVVRPLVGPAIDALLGDPLFRETFQARPFSFQVVRADRLIALQAHVKPRIDPAPRDEAGLISFCLPHRWDVPAELSFTPPDGPIQITSSSPMLQGVRIDLDRSNGRVTLGPAKHINLVQVKEFNGRYYLNNGYHRVFDLLGAGRTEIPALVSKALLLTCPPETGRFAA